MPKKSSKKNSGPRPSVLRAAAAALTAYKAGENGGSTAFFSVQKILGSGTFSVRSENGSQFRAVGGHGGGKARIVVGSIVLANCEDPEQGLEIICVLDSVSREVDELVKNGFLPQAVVNAATTAGAVSQGGIELMVDGYTFGNPDAEVDVNNL